MRDDKFIIVIEADNKRALAAYQKGLADLDLIWPQIEQMAAEKDAKTDAKAAKDREDFDRQFAAYLAADIARSAWEKSNSFFRGDAPPLALPPSSHSWLSYQPRVRDYYQSIRAELKRMADLAGAALGPYRMTEHQVAEMVSWENGRRIGGIKRDIAQYEDRKQEAA